MLMAANCDSGDISSDDEQDSGMRVGSNFQAKIPDILPRSKLDTEKIPHDMLLWKPNHTLSSEKLDEFLTTARVRYQYNVEQALGLLFWHKYNIDETLRDLPNFTPHPEEWNLEDQVLFDQAFAFHGKCFSRIRKMLPDKTTAQLVKYYYSRKKEKLQFSALDKEIRLKSMAVNDNDDEDSSCIEGERRRYSCGNLGTCSWCRSTALSLYSSVKGLLCKQCFTRHRLTNQTSRSLRTDADKSSKPLTRLTQLELDELIRAPEISSKHQQIEDEIMRCKVQVQALKMKKSSLPDIVSNFERNVITETAMDLLQPTSRNWSEHDEMLAVMAFRKYGKNLAAAKAIVGTKTEKQLRDFYLTKSFEYKLDDIISGNKSDKPESENSSNQDDDIIEISQGPLPKKAKSS